MAKYVEVVSCVNLFKAPSPKATFETVEIGPTLKILGEDGLDELFLVRNAK